MHLFSWLLILLVPALTLIWLLLLVQRRVRKIAWLQQHEMRIRATVVGMRVAEPERLGVSARVHPSDPDTRQTTE